MKGTTMRGMRGIRRRGMNERDKEGNERDEEGKPLVIMLARFSIIPILLGFHGL